MTDKKDVNLLGIDTDYIDQNDGKITSLVTISLIVKESICV